MNKPSITDSKVKKYVDHLEKKLEAFTKGNVEVESYLALANFVKQGNKIMESANFDANNLSDKDDKALERAIKFADKVLEYNQSLSELYEKIGTEKIEKEKGKKQAASSYEAAMPARR